MKWSTEKIVKDLEKITKKKVIKEKQAQGDHYCRELSINVGRDGINIAGFIDEMVSDVDNPLEDIEYVEVRNYHSDSEGGLAKDAKPDVRKVYFQVVDYFNKKNIQIVDNLKDHF